MEITPEMIKAVEAHQRAEAKRKHDEYQAECAKRYRENMERIENQAKQGVRAVFPDMTDEQFDELTDVFSTYFEEVWDR